MNPSDIPRIVSLFAALVGVTVCLMLMRQHIRYRYITIIPLSWLFHVLVFYIAFFSFGHFQGTSLDWWPPVVYLHGILTVSIGMLVMYLHVGQSHE